MKVKGFGAWPSRNVSTGGKRPLSDPFNKSFKGDPFNKEYKKESSPLAEYSSFGLDEYHHYPAQQDLTAEQDDQQKNADQKRKDQKAKNAKNAKMRRMRMMQQVVCLAAGSVMIVSSYQASLAQRNAQPTDDPTPAVVDPATPDEPAVTYTALWEWNSDHTAVTCVLSNLAGEIVGEVPAEITTSEVPAGCTTDGKLTYTATAQYDGQSFTDSHDEILPALGHSFDEGTEVLTDDGEPAIDFECTRCHEHFVIVNSITEV